MDGRKVIDSDLEQRSARRSQKLLRRLVVFIVLLNGFIIFKAFVPEQPSYQGKTINPWLRRGAFDRMNTMQQAERPFRPEVVNGFGPGVWPYLAQAIEQTDSPLSRTWTSLWLKLPLRMQKRLAEWSPIPPDLLNYVAYDWLKQLGPDAAGALPDLVEIALHSKKPHFRATAIEALGHVGCESPEALSALLTIIRELYTTNSPNDNLRTCACYAVARFGAKAEPAVPWLAKAVQSKQGWAATNEIEALGLIGPAAQQAVPVLAQALTNNLLRASALTALASIRPTSAHCVAAIIEILKERPVDLRAIEVLHGIGPPARSALPALRGIELTDSKFARAFAALAIAKIESENPRRALQLVLETLHEKVSAPNQPWRMSFQSFEGTSTVVQMEPPPVALLLAECDSELGKESIELKESLSTLDQPHRILAAYGLCAITNLQTEVSAILVEALHRNDDLGLGFHFALLGFEKMGPRARTATPALVDFIQQPTNVWNQRRVVLELLKKVDPDIARGVSLLVK